MRKIGEVNDLFKIKLNMELNGDLIPSVKIGSMNMRYQRESQMSEERKIMNIDLARAKSTQTLGNLTL